MPNKRGKLRAVESNAVLLEDVNWCDSFGGKLLGLMFRKSLGESEGLLMVEPRASKVNTSIHMLFMNFAIATVWLDKDLRVVDKVLAKPWRLAYVPAKPAMYTLETRPEILDKINIGDQLAFEP
jgi:uncharacterized protein